MYFVNSLSNPFSALTLLVVRQEERPSCNNLSPAICNGSALGT